MPGVAFSSSMHSDTSAALASLLSVASSISNLLIVQFLLGLLMGFPSSHIPSLQDEVFGDKAFAIVGAFGGVKGILSLLTGPSIGYFSDAVGRREALMVALFMSLLPCVWVAVFDLFWGYYTTDALFGVYSGAMSVIMACVADQLQMDHEMEHEDVLVNSGDALKKRQELNINDNNNIKNNNNDPHSAAAASTATTTISHPQKAANSSSSTTTATTTTSSSSQTAEELVKRTRAMSIAMASMGIGMIFGAGFGTLLSYQNAFRCSLVAGVVNVCLVHWPMRVYLDRLSVVAQAGGGNNNNNNSNAAASSSTSAASSSPSHFAQQSTPNASAVPTSSNHHHNGSDENTEEDEIEDEDDEDYEDPSVHRHSFQSGNNSSNNNPKNQSKKEKKSLLGKNNNSKKITGVSGTPNQQNEASRNPFVQQSQQAFTSIGNSIARSQRTIKTFTGLRHLAGIVFCDSLVLQAIAILIPLFLKKYLAFTPADQTYMMITLGIASSIGLLAIVPFVTAKIKTMGMLRIALIADMIMVSLYSLVRSKVVAQILPLFTSVGVAMFPCASSLASEVMFGVTNGSEGLAQGIVSAARMFAEGVSPLVLGGLLSVFDKTTYPGAPFLLVGVGELIALWLTMKLEAFMALPAAWRFEDPI